MVNSAFFLWGGGTMPWRETDPMLERRRFIHDFMSGHWAMSELCLRYGVSRVTGYKWVDRHRQGGDAWLVDQNRAALVSRRDATRAR
jgi:transposase-like protein